MIVTKKKIKAMLAAAENALEEGVSRAARFADSKDFKRSLVKALDKHVDFHKAALELHLHTRLAFPPKSGQSQLARQTRPAGRVQAPRHDSPRGKRAS